MLRLLEQLNPFRDPAWRQARVNSLLQNEIKPHRTQDDQDTKRYFTFLAKWRRDEVGDRAREKMFWKYPGIYFAHAFRFHHDDEWRSLLEARILSREPVEMIAAHFSTIPEAVECYERLFFDVRDRLDARDYITKIVMGRTDNRVTGFEGEITPQQRNMIYKLFGYFGGPEVLDVIVTGFSSRPFPKNPDQCDDWLDESMKTCLRQRSNIAGRTFAVNKFNVMQLFELEVRLMEAAQQARMAAGGASVDYNENIKQFLAGIKLGVGKKSKIGKTPATLAFEGTTIEPSADDAHLLSLGYVPDQLQDYANDQDLINKIQKGVYKDDNAPANDEAGGGSVS